MHVRHNDDGDENKRQKSKKILSFSTFSLSFFFWNSFSFQFHSSSFQWGCWCFLVMESLLINLHWDVCVCVCVWWCWWKKELLWIEMNNWRIVKRKPSFRLTFFCFVFSILSIIWWWFLRNRNKWKWMNLECENAKECLVHHEKNVSIFELLKKRRHCPNDNEKNKDFFLIQKKKINDFFAAHKKLNKKEKVSRNQTKSK